MTAKVRRETIRCDICEFKCKIENGETGICKMYINKDGFLEERFPNRYLFIFPISIETQPMLHFYPNHKFLQISTIGCNFRCKGCISEVLTVNPDSISKTLKYLSPDEIIEMAKNEECIGISFGINDPIVSFFSFKKIAEKAKKSNLLVGFSSNLYFTEKKLSEIAKFVDFVNVGIKGFTDKIYKKICNAHSSSPVFRNIRILHKLGIHIEVSIPYIKGEEEEIIMTAKFISNLSKDIPLQIMRFIPFGEADIKLEPSIKEAELLVEKVGKYLKFVYLFNSPGTQYLNTITEEVKIGREFYGPMGAHIVKFIPKKTTIKIMKGNFNKKEYIENGFFGGYRITRAIELIIGILNALGIYNPHKLNKILSIVLKDKEFMIRFHNTIDTDADKAKYNTIYEYINIIDYLSEISSKKQRGVEIKNYLESTLSVIEKKRRNIKIRKTFYYCMGHPLFALNPSRIECLCAEFVGCNNGNSNFEKDGKPGFSISPSQLSKLDPDIIFISGFISISETDFINEAKKLNVKKIKAIKDEKLYKLPVSWDFSSLKWILGIMFIANKVYPEVYNFDLKKEEEKFQKIVYNSYYPHITNHSFYHKFS